MQLIDQLQRAMICKGIGQTELGKLAHISKGNMSKIMKDKSNLRFDTIQRLSIALETSFIIVP